MGREKALDEDCVRHQETPIVRLECGSFASILPLAGLPSSQNSGERQWQDDIATIDRKTVMKASTDVVTYRFKYGDLRHIKGE